MKRNINLKGKLLKSVKEPVSDFMDGDVIIRIDGKERIYSTKAVVNAIRGLITNKLAKLSDSINQLSAVMLKTRRLRKRDPKGMFMKED